jgi:hypothetical protein
MQYLSLNNRLENGASLLHVGHDARCNVIATTWRDWIKLVEYDKAAFLSKNRLKTFAQVSALKSCAVAYTEACRT